VACVLDCGVVRFVGGLNCGTQAICDMKVHSGVYIYIYDMGIVCGKTELEEDSFRYCG
jgi:hypothetical protein